MWWCDRRLFLTAALATAGCGFAPVYAPGGSGGRLQGRIATRDPGNRSGFVFNRRFEERMGRAAGPYELAVTLRTRREGLGSISDGRTTRYRLNGTADYALQAAGEADPVIEGKTHAFTGYSTTGSTAATLAAERDAEDRLMVILADQVIDALILSADALAE
ncbi:hypothetical protein KUH32_03730 [Thalassococcus sp. CAU 1522]|uniref:LPS-assembly lipoprotein n=1 Tax=Thalassococcus arenae TaxID=2851652 RepID=A0ABS6N4Y7_9RHOB|nr:LPS assembly lipoprotein LptE [Thalassococcus arenae]MBV2358873.1 hypothetical protein [Thalassococcus arenae]